MKNKNNLQYRNIRWLSKKLLKGIQQKDIAEMCNVDRTTVERYIKKYKLQNFKNRLSDKMRASDPYMNYLLGLYITDGYYSPYNGCIEITLKQVDRKILHLFGDRYKCSVKYYGNTTRLILNRQKTREFAKIFNLVPGAKTFTASLPTNIPILLQKYVIRGMMDGDGSIRRYKETSARFYSVSKDLIDWYINYCKTKNFRYTIQDDGKVVYTPDLDFLIHIYADYPELSIQRKRKIVSDKVDDIVRAYEMINRKKWVLNEPMIT